MARTERPFDVTPEQVATLGLVSALLAELGYWRLPTPDWYRRTEHDFIMVHKGDIRTATHYMRAMISVRPMKNGSVSVRPYLRGISAMNAKQSLARCKKRAQSPIRWSDQMIPKGRRCRSKDRPDGFRSYFGPTEWEQFETQL